MNGYAADWAALGQVTELCGRRIFTVEIPPHGVEHRPPLLVIHGFPTSSFDFHLVADALAADRRVLLFDMLGYGLSDKPDVHYEIATQADIATAFVGSLGIGRLALLTHDLGDTVGGELLARQLEGDWEVEITERTLTNGSIYIEMAHLSAGQHLLLSLPDERLGDASPLDAASVTAGVAGTFSPSSVVDHDELDAVWEMIHHHDGERLLPRTIRYIEERRRSERRFTGAIERHPSPLTVVWGTDDPIAVVAMTERLRSARADLTLRLLDGVGHYPMLEAPDAFVRAVTAGT